MPQIMEGLRPRAVWANPATRAVLEQQKQAELEATRRAENQRRIEEAKKAASVNVARRGVAPPRPGPMPMDQFIGEQARTLGLLLRNEHARKHYQHLCGFGRNWRPPLTASMRTRPLTTFQSTTRCGVVSAAKENPPRRWRPFHYGAAGVRQQLDISALFRLRCAEHQCRRYC